MTETLPRLLTLQACDRHVQEVVHKLDTLQQSLAALKEEERTKAQEVQAWQDKIRGSEETSDQPTLQIEQVKGQLRGKRGALHRSRAGQQGETVQPEIALLEANKAALEEELRMAQEERLALVGRIKASLLQEYERIFSHRGGVAIVELANGTCQGCHMHVPPQMCLELQRRPRLTFCPHCHRILFVPIETSLPVVEPCSPANSANGRRSPQPQQRPRATARISKKLLETEVPPPNPAQM